MGYCMRMRDQVFQIKAENRERALELARGLIGKETFGGSFSWVSPAEMARAQTIEEMLRAWRWGADHDDDGNIVALDFEGEKLGDDRLLWEAIAPAVEDGSFLEMVGEDGCIWRWWFDGQDCEEQTGTVVFE